ncbi:MAG TPA: hypothetical protein VHE35_23745 [Kofleriaceae bacterium]|nr:hypothetical protein [Kofleriaceae bacterium]
MRSLLYGALVALSGLAACDDNLDHDGARGSCASGGVLAGCPDSEPTEEAACWRLVECGIYPLDGDQPDDLDWGRCMDELDAMYPERRDGVIQCIVTSTCDQLVPVRSSRPACFQFGDT